MDQEAAARLITGEPEEVREWNRFRNDSSAVLPDLRGIRLEGGGGYDETVGPDLHGLDLSDAVFVHPILNSANLRETILRGAQMGTCSIQDSDLSKADLTGASLFESGCDGSTFDNAKLDGANLENVGFHGGSFRGASLVGATLSGANLTDAEFTGADLSKTTCGESYDHVSARFYRTGLSYTNFDSADLRKAGMTGADLSNARMTNADLREADLSRARVAGADFSGADLRGVHGILFDNNSIEGTRLPSRGTDPWSVLLRTYTGTRFLIRMLLLVLFLLPLVAKTLLLVAVHEVEIRAATPLLSLSSEPDGSAPRIEAAPGGAPYEDAKVSSWVPTANLQRWPIWKVLLGLNEGAALALFTSSLILYNLMRALLTLRVFPLREELERTDRIPAFHYRWTDYQEEQPGPVATLLRRLPTFHFGYRRTGGGHRIPRTWSLIPWGARARIARLEDGVRFRVRTYGWLYRIHVAVGVLLWVAIGSLILTVSKIVGWLQLPVWLPG